MIVSSVSLKCKPGNAAIRAWDVLLSHVRNAWTLAQVWFSRELNWFFRWETRDLVGSTGAAGPY